MANVVCEAAIGESRLGRRQGRAGGSTSGMGMSRGASPEGQGSCAACGGAAVLRPGPADRATDAALASCLEAKMQLLPRAGGGAADRFPCPVTRIGVGGVSSRVARKYRPP